MQLEQAIEKALDGNAILFAGAGCSSGAVNLRGEPFKRGLDLARYFSERCNLPTDTHLEDAAEAFAEMFGVDKLISEIQNEFTVKELAQHHILMGADYSLHNFSFDCRSGSQNPTICLLK